ncbi:hypothetical protein ACHAPJ_012703 [Fusarium lateritium]
MQLTRTTLLALLCGTSIGSSVPPSPSVREEIVDSILALTQSFDDKNETLLRASLADDVIFDGELFADIGLAGPDPIIRGRNDVAKQLLAALSMTTTHHISNFRIQMGDNKQANFTVYALACHYKELEDPRENPKNHYIMGTRYEGGLRKEKGAWKLVRFRPRPVWQSGNINVMGLNGA